MRALLIIAGAALALGGCGHKDQAGATQNADDNLTAQSIVSNDVTAIDAVTGDAANMAADVDTNYGGLEAGNGPGPTQATPRAARHAADTNSAAPETNTVVPAAGNTE